MRSLRSALNRPVLVCCTLGLVLLLTAAPSANSPPAWAGEDAPIGTRWRPKLGEYKETLHNEIVARLRPYVAVKALLNSELRTAITVPLDKQTLRLDWRMVVGDRYVHLYPSGPWDSRTLDWTPWRRAVRQPRDASSGEATVSYFRKTSGPIGHQDGKIRDPLPLPEEFHEPALIDGSGRVRSAAPKRVPLIRAEDNTYRRHAFFILPVASIEGFKKFKHPKVELPQYLLIPTELVFRDNGPAPYR